MKFLKLVIASFAVAVVTAKQCGSGIGSCPKGYCCSKYGYCGKTEDYCGTGCQTKFGVCTTGNNTKNTKKVSKNGRCGSSFGSCPNSKCCSKYGYCGTSDAHCGTGCQSEFGKCNKKATKKTTTTKKATKKTTTTKKATKKTTTTTTKKSVVKTTKKTTTTTKKTTTVTSKKTSTNGLCGGKNGVCPDDLCCSQYGYCGSSDEYCGKGCQSEFGKCGKKSTNSTASKKVSTNGQCGGNNGVCPDNLCCSQYGYCGTSDAHCGKGCQSEFGKCGSSSKTSSSSSTTSNGNVNFKIYDKCKKDKQWALTFDDGPFDHDIKLLNLLKNKGVKATFFVNGDNVMDIKSSEGRERIKMMHKQGHIIGNHTWRHTDLNEADDETIKEEMKKLEDAVYDIIGKRPAFMRLPYGSGSGNKHVHSILSDLGYTAGFQWNVDTNDWKYEGDVDYALARFKEKIGSPILSLNHVYYSGITDEKLLTLIEKEIDYMISQGYTPVTVDECIGLPAYK